MEMKQAAFLFMLFSLVLLTASSSSNRSLNSVQLQEENKGTVEKSNFVRNQKEGGLVQIVRTGHGGGSSGSSGGRDGGNDSPSNNRTPGSSAVIPVYAADAAQSRKRQQCGAAIHSHTCNLSVLTAAILLFLLFL